jgi:hypothetical protein
VNTRAGSEVSRGLGDRITQRGLCSVTGFDVRCDSADYDIVDVTPALGDADGSHRDSFVERERSFAHCATHPGLDLARCHIPVISTDPDWSITVFRLDGSRRISIGRQVDHQPTVEIRELEAEIFWETIPELVEMLLDERHFLAPQ